ncbi:2-isopropylmalate synthase [Acinetobacter nectaris CIP 110549]|uniref:2-isopropylmalate synthase n=1 Tax=Acinetobacter nectaris CIP 110549 TaxID=1392540 RepID=V2UPM6_9GAMM|nr:2-isopropylmalate synthase [Acinetobacter nectaris]ESK37284.1 2-isopropylmalate synthase [Acinetobacter nectaris CIP 110549]
MLAHPQNKYRQFESFDFPERSWPNKQITQAPIWCSTDLRDGNQALANPMDQYKKNKFFQSLVECGFKQIEVAFPAASETDFHFVRNLIEKNKIPDDVSIQVMTQARSDLIERTFESLVGVKQAIVHVYNATAEVFRRIVFQKTKQEIIELAIESTRQVKSLCLQHPETKWTYQYSPETFCFTEIEFALEICEAVAKIWEPSPEYPMIINLPTTVEVSTPNIFADQIEYFCKSFSKRNHVCISVHPHNDRGTGVATAELALLAGADRVEGCLFGNGERTGNVDLVNIALNMYTQGISPKLDFSDIKNIAEVVKECNELPIHPRHPYVGDLVFTAFSGSHQDAIKKGFKARKSQKHQYWEVPYLPIDPADLGASYEAVIRVNSQSGKSGTAWVLQQNHGIELPIELQKDFSQIVQKVTDSRNAELSHAEIWKIFQKEYGINPTEVDFKLINYQSQKQNEIYKVQISISIKDEVIHLVGSGNGLLSASVQALNTKWSYQLKISEYSEHALGRHTGSRSISYIRCTDLDGYIYWGVSIDTDIATASIQALLNGFSQCYQNNALVKASS